MRRLTKQMGALALCLCLLLSLAACAKGGEQEKDDQLSGTVYVPQFIDLDLGLGKNGRVDSGCTDGKNVYLLTAAYPDWEAGETGDTRYAIMRVPLDGGEPAALENFKMMEKPEGYTSSYAYISGIRAGTDGTIWVGESVNAQKYDLPEDFDEEKDQYWNYEMLEDYSAEFQVQLDSTGNVISRVDVSDLREKAEVEYVYSDSMLFDKEGDLCVTGEGKLIVLDPNMNVRFTIEQDVWGGDMVLLSDGRVGVRVVDVGADGTVGGYYMKVIDKDAKGWGESYKLPSQANDLYAGGGDYLFYYKSGESVYGCKAEAEGTGTEREAEGEWLFNWLDSDINSDDVQFFSILEDGRIAVMTRSWSRRGQMSQQLAVLTATDRSTLPEKTTLTYAVMYLGSEERNRILEFNKSSQTYRIQVKDYSEFNTEEDYQAGIQKLNTEIIAGNVPDIINVSNLPIRQYGAKGILEDLWPYIDQDPDLSREALMERVFTAAEQDGKLYQVFDTFSIGTIAGATGVVGDRMSWKLADLQAALATMPEGCAVFGQYDTRETMLSYVMSMNLDSFLDWNTGECHFDSEEFKSLLSFCAGFPAEREWDGNEEYDDEPTRVSEGRQMLMHENVGNFQDIQMHKAIFGGAVTYVGFPAEDGSVGSCFSTYSGLAMSSACKDKEGAWSYLRQILLPQYADESVDTDAGSYWGMGGGFPTNKADFDWMAKQSMTPAGYEVDENGNQVLDEDGNPIETSNSDWSWGSVSIDIYATKQEEYDQIMALYNAVDRMSGTDSNVLEIVNEVAGSYFAGDRSLDEAAALIQNRVNTYVNEQR